MYRSHTCGELRIIDKGKSVQLAGWVQTIRKYGSITFVDLRDRYGITQLLFGESVNAQLDQQPLGREFVLQVQGTVIERSNKNIQIPTGEIEIEVTSFAILNRSAVPPFTIQDDTDGGDDIRMKYRFLDLRRNAVKKNLESILSIMGKSLPFSKVENDIGRLANAVYEFELPSALLNYFNFKDINNSDIHQVKHLTAASCVFALQKPKN